MVEWARTGEGAGGSWTRLDVTLMETRSEPWEMGLWSCYVESTPGRSERGRAEEVSSAVDHRTSAAVCPRDEN